MKAPEPNQFSKLHNRNILYAAGSVLVGLLIAAVIYNMTPSDKAGYEGPKSIKSGNASFLLSQRDSSEFDPYGVEMSTKVQHPPSDSNYVPPTPEELFGNSGIAEQLDPTPKPRSGAGQARPRRTTRPKPDNNMFNEAMQSDIQISGSGGNSSPYASGTPAGGDIQRYRNEAQALQNTNPYSNERAGQGFQGSNHQDISGRFKTPDTPYTLLEGTLIPATLQTGINSNLPGNIIGFVTRNIYDSIQQNYLLIPKGSKLIGSYDQKVVLNQSKLLMSWQRIIFPDGRSLRLPSLNTHDLQGKSGLGGKVNRHFWKIFGQSAMLSLIGAGTAVATQGQTSSNPFNQTQGVGEQAAQQIATEFNRVSNQVLQRNLNTAPTINIDAGTRFNIFLAGDISFQQPYEYKAPGQ